MYTFSRLAASALSLIIVVGGAHAQINLNSTEITFRSSANVTPITSHYGNLSIMGGGTTANSKVLQINDQNASAIHRYGVYSTANSTAGYGYGGYFEGGYTGVYALAQKNGIGYRYAGRFFAANTLSDNIIREVYGIRSDASTGSVKHIPYGIFASATNTGGGTAYAGYFSGNVYVAGTITQTSDERLKREITPMEKILDKVLRLKPVRYYFDTDKYQAQNLPKQKQIGLTAQDVEAVFPEIVQDERLAGFDDDAAGGKAAVATGEPPTFKSVNYIALIPVLVAAIQEQQKEIQALKRVIGGE